MKAVPIYEFYVRCNVKQFFGRMDVAHAKFGQFRSMLIKSRAEVFSGGELLATGSINCPVGKESSRNGVEKMILPRNDIARRRESSTCERENKFRNNDAG